MVLEESEDYQIDERTNPNGTIDDISNEDEIIKELVENTMSYLLNFDHIINVKNGDVVVSDPSFSENHQWLNMRVRGYGTLVKRGIKYSQREHGLG